MRRGKVHGGWRWLTALAALALLTSGCQRIQARAELKQGNALYAEGRYDEALGRFRRGLELDPSAAFAWRSVGFAAVALHRPGDHGAENERHADAAVEAFHEYLRSHPGDQEIEEYLLTVLLNAERYDEAIAHLERRAASGDGAAGSGEAERAISRVLIEAGRLEEAFARAEAPGREPDPEVLYSIGVACWDRAANDPDLDSRAAGEAADLGLRATARAIELRPDYAEAMAYHNLLLRQKARLEPDPFVQQDWIAEAVQWHERALALTAARSAAQPASDRAPAEGVAVDGAAAHGAAAEAAPAAGSAARGAAAAGAGGAG